MKISRHASYRILKPDSNQPRNRSEGPCETHARVNHSDRIVQLSVPEVVERLGESKLAHDIKTKPAEALIGRNGLWSIVCNNSFELASINLDLSLI